MDKIKSNLSPLAQTPALDSELGKLGALLDQLTFEYKAKKEAMTNSIGPDSTGITKRHGSHWCTVDAICYL